MNSSPPVRWTQRNCGQRVKNRATSSGVISSGLSFCQMLHISQRKLQWYVATNVTLYGRAGDTTFADAIARASPSRVTSDDIPESSTVHPRVCQPGTCWQLPACPRTGKTARAAP